MEPVISALSEKYQGKVSFIIVDVENQTDPSVDKLASQFKVQYIPTIILTNSQGQVVKEHVGAVSEEELRADIDKLIE